MLKSLICCTFAGKIQEQKEKENKNLLKSGICCDFAEIKQQKKENQKLAEKLDPSHRTWCGPPLSRGVCLRTNKLILQKSAFTTTSIFSTSKVCFSSNFFFFKSLPYQQFFFFKKSAFRVPRWWPSCSSWSRPWLWWTLSVSFHFSDLSWLKGQKPKQNDTSHNNCCAKRSWLVINCW